MAEAPEVGRLAPFSLPTVVRTHTDSGAELQLVAAGSVPKASIRLVLPLGTAHEAAGQTWISRLVSEYLKEGAGDLDGTGLADAVARMGGHLDVNVDDDTMTISSSVLGEYASDFVKLLGQIVREPTFPVSELDRLKSDLQRNLDLSKVQPGALAAATFRRALYAGHPYEATEMGTERGLAAITLDDVRAFHAGRYLRDNMLIGVAGGYPDGFLERVERDLGGALPSGDDAGDRTLPAPRVVENIELLLVEKDAIATAISIGFPINITRASDDFYPLMVANAYFGEHRTFIGRLMNQMRGLRGLNYGDYSYIENFIQDGGSTFPVPNTPRRQQFFSLWIRPVPHHNAAFALRQAVRELGLLVEQGLSPEEFEATREYLVNYSKLYVQTTSRRLGYAMDSRFYGTGPFVDEIRTRLESLTVDEVNAAVRRHLQAENLGIAVVTRDAEAFRDALLSDAPSSVTYNTEVDDAILAEDEAIKSYPLVINPERVRVVPVEEMFVDVS